MPAFEFGKTGMGRDRFKEIFSTKIYSKQLSHLPYNLRPEQYRWMLVGDHVANFNKKCARNYHPLDSIYVDESMSRWYGIGGNWINSGLPDYIAIDRKTENGCDIQNTADGLSGIMMQMKLVNNSSEEDLHSPEENYGFLHCTKVMLSLLQPWVNKQ